MAGGTHSDWFRLPRRTNPVEQGEPVTPIQQLAAALPLDPADHGPVAVPSDAIRGVLSELAACQEIITDSRWADIAPEQASAVVWSLFDDWQRAHIDITSEMGYEPLSEEVENRRQALVALFGART